MVLFTLLGVEGSLVKINCFSLCGWDIVNGCLRWFEENLASFGIGFGSHEKLVEISIGGLAKTFMNVWILEKQRYKKGKIE